MAARVVTRVAQCIRSQHSQVALKGLEVRICSCIIVHGSVKRKDLLDENDCCTFFNEIAHFCPPAPPSSPIAQNFSFNVCTQVSHPRQWGVVRRIATSAGDKFFRTYLTIIIRAVWRGLLFLSLLFFCSAILFNCDGTTRRRHLSFIRLPSIFVYL